MLDKIIEVKRKQVELEKERVPLKELEGKIDTTKNARFAKSLKGEGVKIIAEIKKASPSKGIINENIDPVVVAKQYVEGGADSISVLTEEKFFLGRNKYLMDVKKEVPCPVLRKDFIIDEYQIYQSKVIGADAILLIVTVLQERTKELYNLSKQLGLECLVEVHDEKELELALEAGAEVIGVNNRNLKDFTVSLDTTKNLISSVPKDVVKVSESGIRAKEDINYLRSLGVNAFLIGETLMRSGNVIQELRKLKGG